MYIQKKENLSHIIMIYGSRVCILIFLMQNEHEIIKITLIATLKL